MELQVFNLNNCFSCLNFAARCLNLGVLLFRSKDVYVLKLDEDINEDEERHLLLLKNFCLGINAVESKTGCFLFYNCLCKC